MFSFSRSNSWDNKSVQSTPSLDTKLRYITPPLSPFKSCSSSCSQLPNLDRDPSVKAYMYALRCSDNETRLLSFRGFLLPQLQDRLVASIIIEYADLQRFGVIRKGGSEKEVKRLVKRLYRVDVVPRSSMNAVESLKHWFLPGWFLMSGAHGVILRVKASTSDAPHYILISAYPNNASDSPSKIEATVYDSGEAIKLRSRDDLQMYLYQNGYTEVCPMAVGYPKQHRKNLIVKHTLELCQVYFDINMVPSPTKASAMRTFINARTKFLEAYFANVESSTPFDQLRFKSKFLLSRRVSFDESNRYKVTVLPQVQPTRNFEPANKNVGDCVCDRIWVSLEWGAEPGRCR
mmetsp:Transcript_1907/g.3690  ORF Transcript_1907/g.3690 Transcript_1907/m.3690 type:complete len:347 (-) Transcript_1907:725-1765(-)